MALRILSRLSTTCSLLSATTIINAQVDMDCKTAAIALINALICAGPGRDSPTFRAHIRHEFLMLGIDPVLDTLRKVRPRHTLTCTHIGAHARVHTHMHTHTHVHTPLLRSQPSAITTSALVACSPTYPLIFTLT